MGGSSKQTTGYKYFSNFLLFIGNPIEKLLGINFDKRGWLHLLVDENGNALSEGIVNSPNLYGENEGGVAGKVHAKYGTANPEALQFYSAYLAENDLPPLAYPFQSYLAFEDFYLGNSGYMKEMLLWPKRTRVRNDGREQWYKTRTNGDGGEDIVCEVYATKTATAAIKNDASKFNINWELITDAEPFIHTKNNKLVYYNGESDVVSSESDGILVKGNPSSYSEPFDVYLKAMPECNGVSEFRATLIVICQSYSYEVYGEVHSDAVISENTENGEKTIVISGVVNNSSRLIGIHLNVGGMILSDGVPTICAKASFSFNRPKNEIDYRDTRYPDINPIHKIREILTDDTAMNKPESDVNDTNFMKAADRIWDEGLGISWSITEKSCLDAINELCGHIEAGVRVNRQTGLYEMVLFRDDWFEENEIHTLAVNKIKSMSLDVSNADEAINQLNVSYYNRDAIKDSSFSIAENASIRNLNGRVNAEDADFPYFMNQRNAAVVAQWKLKQMSTPVWSGSFTTAAYEARKWNRYDLLKLAWPRKWQGTITVRIMKINLGTSTDVSIDFVEVVPYSSELSSNIVIDTPIDVAPLPPQACQYEPFELPYYLAVMALGQRQVDVELAYESNYGLVGVVAEKPQSNSLYAVMMTHDGTEGEEWLRAATINYEPAAELDQSISKTSISFTVKNSSALKNISADTLIKCGSDWIGTPGEWMVYQSMDPNTGVVTVKRGALDTIPQSWQSGTLMYFCGNDVAYDQTEYIAGEEVLVSALTTTPSGIFEQKGSIAVEMNARAFRPYPPANVKINGEYWPDIIRKGVSEIEVTWVDRNRAQQTGGDMIGWYEGGVSIESDVEYIVNVYDRSSLVIQSNAGLVNNFSFDSGLITSGLCRVQVLSQRDGYESLHCFDHEFIVENSKVIFIFDDEEDYTPPNAMSVNFTEQ